MYIFQLLFALFLVLLPFSSRLVVSIFLRFHWSNHISNFTSNKIPNCFYCFIHCNFWCAFLLVWFQFSWAKNFDSKLYSFFFFVVSLTFLLYLLSKFLAKIKNHKFDPSSSVRFIWVFTTDSNWLDDLSVNQISVLRN